MSVRDNSSPRVQIGPLAERPAHPNFDGLFFISPALISVYDAASGLWIDAGGGGSSTGSSPNFVFADFGTQDPSQGRYTSWTDLMAALQQVQFGAAPMVRLALEGGPFTVPLAGMPLNGWDFRGGRITSFYSVTGVETLVVPAGVKLNNLFGIGTGGFDGGSVVIQIAPPAGTGVLEFSGLPSGAPKVFSIGLGSAINHSTSTGALIRTTGVNDFAVLAVLGANQNDGVVPVLSGPLVQLQGNDSAVGVQFFALNGLPNGWLAGGGAGSQLTNIYDIGANANTLNPGVFIPGFTGTGGISYQNFDKSSLLPYAPVAPANWAGPPPENVATALDRLAAAVAGLLGGPIP